MRGRPLRVRLDLPDLGKALAVSARCDEPVVSRFSLGDVGLAPLRRTFPVPYLPGHVALPAGAERVRRAATSIGPRRTPRTARRAWPTYEPKTDGTRNPLVETGYIAVSPDLGEVLPNIPHPPSPYLALLGPRIMLDIWGHHQGTYQRRRARTCWR